LLQGIIVMKLVRWLHWIFLMRMRKISIRISTVFEKKSQGLRLSYTTKKVHYYINSLAIEYEGRKSVRNGLRLNGSQDRRGN
jgi:hypothetical protein